MLLIGSRRREMEGERYQKRIMNDLASERAGKLTGLSGIILHRWFGISFGEYRWIWDHAREQSLGKETTPTRHHLASTACTSRAVPLSVFGETSTEETIPLLIWHSKSRWWESRYW
jgi:hypothetical protein